MSFGDNVNTAPAIEVRWPSAAQGADHTVIDRGRDYVLDDGPQLVSDSRRQLILRARICDRRQLCVGFAKRLEGSVVDQTREELLPVSEQHAPSENLRGTIQCTKAGYEVC